VAGDQAEAIIEPLLAASDQHEWLARPEQANPILGWLPPVNAGGGEELSASSEADEPAATNAADGGDE
jgi:hypothetical protein